MKISISHIRDGIKEYDYKRFEKFKNKLQYKISYLHGNNFNILLGDIISVSTVEGDEFFYYIKERTIRIKNGRILVDYWVNDLEFKKIDE